MPSPPRSVKISDDERTGWSSERPRRPGEAERPPREPDVAVRGRVLSPSDRLRYTPGSVVLIACPDAQALDRFCARVLEEPGALLSTAKIRALLSGKVAADQLEAKTAELLAAAVAKRLDGAQSTIIALDTLDAAERHRYVLAAARNRRTRHLLLLEVPKEAVAAADVAPLTELRTALDAGELGAEGFATSLRLGGRAVEEVKRIVFRPPPSDD
jgi:hypothetical protein